MWRTRRKWSKRTRQPKMVGLRRFKFHHQRIENNKDSSKSDKVIKEEMIDMRRRKCKTECVGFLRMKMNELVLDTTMEIHHRKPASQG